MNDKIKVKDIILSVKNKELTPLEMLNLIDLMANKIGLDTIVGIREKYGGTFNGIKYSNNYKKLTIGKQLMCLPKGVLRDDEMPF